MKTRCVENCPHRIYGSLTQRKDAFEVKRNHNELKCFGLSRNVQAIQIGLQSII